MLTWKILSALQYFIDGNIFVCKWRNIFLDDQWHTGIIAGTTGWKLTTFLDFLIQPAMPCNILSITALSLDVDIMNSFYQSLFMWLGSYSCTLYKTIEYWEIEILRKNNKLRPVFVMLIQLHSFLFQYNWTRDNSRKIVKNISGEDIIIIMETDVEYLTQPDIVH